MIEGRSTTYGELHVMADRVATWLRHQGAGPGTHVAIRFPISVEAVASVLGILKAGCVLVANHPGFSADKLAKQLVGSGAEFLITEDGKLLPSLFEGTGLKHSLLIGAQGPSEDDRIATFDEISSAETFNKSSPSFVPDSEQTAVIFYTTGSTFDPKGVV